MTERVNGRVEQGFWDERKVVYMAIAGDFTLPTVALPDAPSVWDVGAEVQQVMNILQTRGTVIAFCSTADDAASVIYGTSAGEFDQTLDTVPLAEVNAELALIGAGYVATVHEGFMASDVQQPAP